MAGRIITETSFNLSRGVNDLQLPSAGWSAGIYSFKFITATGENMLKRVVKIK